MASKLFDHEELRVYQSSIAFIGWLEGINSGADKRIAAHGHLVRASESIPVNIAEASGKKSMKERRQYIDTAYGSSLECAACLDILNIMDLIPNSTKNEGKAFLRSIVPMLINYRKSTDMRVKEGVTKYSVQNEEVGHELFDHEKLKVYQKALSFIRWLNTARSNSFSRSHQTKLDKPATGVTLNIAEGNGKFSTKDRCRFIDHSRTAALQAASNLDIIAIRNSQCAFKCREGKSILAECVRMLVAWRNSIEERGG